MKLQSHLMGFRRENGKIGIRNHIVVMAAADNVNPLLHHIGSRNPGVVLLPASYGRGQLGEDLEITLRSMAGLAAHPNVAGCLIVSFEEASAERIAERVRGRDSTIRCLSFLTEGGMEPCLDRAQMMIDEIRQIAHAATREPFEYSELVMGLECGGSDTTSGLYANPALGRLTDALHAHNSTLIFSEPVECLGGEKSLVSRARTREAADAMLKAIKGFEIIAQEAGIDLGGINPTADNIAGGLTTIEEKSLGAIAKTGSVTIEGCIGYGEHPPHRGLWMMDAPAAAVENLTALAAGGCQITAFVTGSCNPIGHTIMPTVKISANQKTTQVMADHIDVDLAQHFSAGLSLDEAASAISENVARVINGAETAAETLRYLHSNISRFGKSV
jgi:altronate dehydratase large subunit